MSADVLESPPELVPAPAASLASTSAPSSVIRTKNGTVSKMRAHRGNVPTLPQTKLCHLCPAKFTRTTHLNRHLKTHSNERMHECDRCHAQFTRSDLLTRHKRTCCDSSVSRSRRKSCQSCADSKVKCDLQRPCAKCKSRGRECVYAHDSSAPGDSPDSGLGSSSQEKSSSNEGTSPSSSDAASSPEAATSAAATALAVEFLTTNDLLSPMPPFAPLTHLASTSQAVSTTADAVANAASLSSVTSATITPQSLETLANNPTMMPTGAHTAEEKAYFTELFASTLYDNLFSDLFTSSFTKNPPVPGQHFQQDATAILTERFEGTGIDQAVLNAFYDTPTQIAIPQVTVEPTVDAQDSIPETELRSTISPLTTAKEMPNIAEMYEYISTFFTTFTYHMPIIHLPTFLSEKRHILLVKATKASGAMYFNTPASTNFIDFILARLRDEIIAEMSHTTDYDTMIQLTLASCLIQTIGMFHKDGKERTKSNVYHGMITMMIRLNGFVDKTRDWKFEPFDFNDPDAVRKAWRDWVRYESAKRAIWVCFLHDCSHAIFFNLSPTFHTEQFTLGLPAEDALWTAKNPQEWAAILQAPSPYGTMQVRLCGHYLKALYFYMVQDNPTGEARHFNVTPFAHFVLIHAMLRKLFEMYLRDRLPFHQEQAPSPPSAGAAGASGSASGSARRQKVNPHFVDKDRVFHLNILLHCWLQSWQHSPDTPRNVAEGEQRFLFNALPFYWLTQVGLIAYQEGLPPFDPEGTYITSHDAKFHLMKKWEKSIRKFLQAHGQSGEPTKLWDDVMTNRTELWQNESGFEYSHLLGFFST